MSLRSLQEKCGIVAIGCNAEDAVYSCLLGLHSLQHRGHEAFGVACTTVDNNIELLRKSGAVNLMLSDLAAYQKAKCAIGHVRYSTSGRLDFCQPIYTKTNLGDIAIAHNGNLTNAEKLRQKLMQQGRVFASDVDTEVFVHLIAQSKKDKLIERLTDALKQVQGAYSLVLSHKSDIFGIRDQRGIRPLVLGKMKDSYVLASETCALDIMDAEFVRDIKPGEIIQITGNAITSYFPLEQKEKKFCIFEYVYFARSDSLLEGRNAYDVRKAIGIELAKESYTKTDMIVPVLDSGMAAALGYSNATAIPLELAIVRNNYAGRTFIEPTNQKRILKVKLKHNANKSLLQGKSITLIDDSIVRGNTLKQIVKILKKAGVTKIHAKIASPMVKNPCYYGVDMPDRAGLLAANFNITEMQDLLGVDSLYFLSLQGLYKAVCKESNNTGFCDACFSGKSPMTV